MWKWEKRTFGGGVRGGMEKRQLKPSRWETEFYFWKAERGTNQVKLPKFRLLEEKKAIHFDT